MINRFVLLLIISIILGACEGSPDDDRKVANEKKIESFLRNNDLTYTKQNGVYYATRVKGFGNRIADGDSIAFWYIGYTLNGIIFDTNIIEVAEEYNLDTSVRDFNPIEVIAGNSTLIEGLNRGVMLCREGEWGTVLFPAELGFGDDFVGSIDPWSPLAYDIFIIYVKNQQILQEQNFISNFVGNSEGFTIDSIGFWIKFLEQNENSSEFGIGDTIYAKVNGQSLYSEEAIELPSESKQLVLSEQVLNEGVLHGFLRLSEGERAQLVLPSCLAFGTLGNDSINPYEPMLYEILLDSIKNNNN